MLPVPTLQYKLFASAVPTFLICVLTMPVAPVVYADESIELVAPSKVMSGCVGVPATAKHPFPLLVYPLLHVHLHAAVPLESYVHDCVVVPVYVADPLVTPAPVGAISAHIRSSCLQT